MSDMVNQPPHYTNHPSGIECIQITEHMSFTLGNAMKYIWRADMKNGVEDLKKAMWYLQREVEKRENDMDCTVSSQLDLRFSESIPAA